MFWCWCLGVGVLVVWWFGGLVFGCLGVLVFWCFGVGVVVDDDVDIDVDVDDFPFKIPLRCFKIVVFRFGVKIQFWSCNLCSCCA